MSEITTVGCVSIPISADISTDTILSIYRLRVLPIHRYIISEAIFDDISECLPTAIAALLPAPSGRRGGRKTHIHSGVLCVMCDV